MVEDDPSAVTQVFIHRVPSKQARFR